MELNKCKCPDGESQVSFIDFVDILNAPSGGYFVREYHYCPACDYSWGIQVLVTQSTIDRTGKVIKD